MKTLAEGEARAGKGRSGSPFIKPIEVDDIPGKSIAGRDEHWGYELIIDLSGCNRKIDDEAAVKAFLKDMVGALKMKAIGDPYLARPPKGDGHGISALQFITTSSILFHGDDQNWCAYLNIFSCAPFAPKTAIAVVKKHFAPRNMGNPIWLHRDAGRWPEK